MTTHFDESLLGTMTDYDIAEMYDVEVSTVIRRRMKLGIPAYCQGRPSQWRDEYAELLHSDKAKNLAKLWNVSKRTIDAWRRKR